MIHRYLQVSVLVLLRCSIFVGSTKVISLSVPFHQLLFNFDFDTDLMISSTSASITITCGHHFPANLWLQLITCMWNGCDSITTVANIFNSCSYWCCYLQINYFKHSTYTTNLTYWYFNMWIVDSHCTWRKYHIFSVRLRWINAVAASNFWFCIIATHNLCVITGIDWMFVGLMWEIISVFCALVLLYKLH
jgi:hypothetical protein